MLRKLVLVYNPQSSHYRMVDEEVLAPARKVRGRMVAKYAVKPTGFWDNVANLQKLLDDGDLVVTAGGDGTAAITLNAVMNSEKDVAWAVLGYGNFNDTARMLNEKSFASIVEDFEAESIRVLYPLEIVVNGKLWRYAASYFTM